jgi:hypothetical protein
MPVYNVSPCFLCGTSVLTTNYVGFTGGLRVIEDIYDVVLSTYA